MIIHIWMHWFWITTVSLKGFLFFTVQMISLSCISHPFTAEAGLLNNETFFKDQNVNLYNQNNSSQIEHNPNITLVPVVSVHENHPPETAGHQSASSPIEETSTESFENESTSKIENPSRVSQASDIADTYNGGNLDVFQYPMKKFTKYSHIKYGKVKVKPKGSEEANGEERQLESVKIVEEKLNINISIAGDDAGHLEPEVDKLNDSITEGNSTEILSSETAELITTTTTPSIENSTLDVNNETEILSESVSTTEETVLKDEPSKPENESRVVATSTPETTTSPEILNVTEDQKEILISKNETLVIENKVEESGVHSSVEPFILKNRVAAATSAQSHNQINQSGLNAGSITGITLGILVVFSLFGAVSFVLYRRRYLNKPQVLHDKCSNLDSSGYIDDTSLRENSEEMYSLDNDSFLNSLEAMTIQNYWTENVKHTKL